MKIRGKKKRRKYGLTGELRKARKFLSAIIAVGNSIPFTESVWFVTKLSAPTVSQKFSVIARKGLPKSSKSGHVLLVKESVHASSTSLTIYLSSRCRNSRKKEESELKTICAKCGREKTRVCCHKILLNLFRIVCLRSLARKKTLQSGFAFLAQLKISPY